MPKPDPKLLDPDNYPHHFPIEPRFSDLDLHKHINNSSLIKMLEEARVRFHRDCGFGFEQKDFAIVVANMSVDYLAEGQYPQTVDVATGVAGFGRTSYTVIQLATQGGQPICLSRLTLVNVRNGQVMVHTPEFIEALAPWKLRP